MGCSQFNFQLSTCTQVDIGFDFSRVLTVTDEGGIVDLTGSTLEMIIKDTLGGATIMTLPVVLDADTTGFYIPSPTTGIVNMQITAVDSGLIAEDWYVYETILTDSAGKIGIFMQGSIQFSTRDF